LDFIWSKIMQKLTIYGFVGCVCLYVVGVFGIFNLAWPNTIYPKNKDKSNEGGLKSSLEKEIYLGKKELNKELYFDLLDWGQVDDVESGKLMVDDVRLKFRPAKGKINQTTTRFGITDEDLGSAVSLIDGKSYIKGDKPESLVMYFSKAVEVLEIRLSSFTDNGKNSERAKLEIAGYEFEMVARPEAQDVYYLKDKNHEPIKLAKMERFTLTWVHGNGFSLDGIKVRTIPKTTTLK